jgi:hypothetical protein
MTSIWRLDPVFVLHASSRLQLNYLGVKNVNKMMMPTY